MWLYANQDVPAPQKNPLYCFTPPPSRTPRDFAAGKERTLRLSSRGLVSPEKAGGIIVKIGRPDSGRSPGFVIAVGKRMFPKATDRNLLKRRIKSALRELGRYHLGERFIIRVVALPAARTATYQEIESALDQKFRELAIHDQ